MLQCLLWPVQTRIDHKGHTDDVLSPLLGNVCCAFSMAESWLCGPWYDMPSSPLCSSKWQVGGLASENVRWGEAVQNLKQQERKLCGDILLTAASISYLGFFTKRYRQSLLDAAWRPYLSQLQVCLAHITRELT